VRYFLIFIISIGLFSTYSCYRPLESETPVLEEELMIKILADIHLAEARLSDYNSMPAARRDSFAVDYYATIFEIHQVDTADFQQSIKAYMTNPDAMNKLYEKVLTRLQQNETQYVKGTKKKDRTAQENKSKKTENPLLKKNMPQ
jgi:arylamine N-acetyltransferase